MFTTIPFVVRGGPHWRSRAEIKKTPGYAAGFIDHYAYSLLKTGVALASTGQVEYSRSVWSVAGTVYLSADKNVNFGLHSIDRPSADRMPPAV
jgi:hypothetical protein